MIICDQFLENAEMVTNWSQNTFKFIIFRREISYPVFF